MCRWKLIMPTITILVIRLVHEGTRPVTSSGAVCQNKLCLTHMTHKQLELQADEIREDIIKMLVEAGSGQSAGPLGLADIFTALYFEVLSHRPKQPDWPERDRLFLSN